MSVRRNKLDIIYEILEFIEKQGNSRITPLMYRINISYSATKEYLEFLEKNKLIEMISQKPKIYRLTAKGMRFRELIRLLKELVEVETFAQIRKKPKRM